MINNKEISVNNLEQDIIDLNIINLKKINIDISELYGADKYEVVQEHLFKKMLSDEIKENTDQRVNLARILGDYTKNPSDWAMESFPEVYPFPKESKDELITVLYLGSGNFAGVLLFDVNLQNNWQGKKNIKEAFTDKKIVFNNDDTALNEGQAYSYFHDKIGILEKINSVKKEEIQDLTWDDITITNYTYNEFTVSATDKCQFWGDITFKYKCDPIALSSNSIQTAEARTDSYAAEKLDVKSNTFTYTPVLGKKALLSTYTVLNFRINGFTWDDRDGASRNEHQDQLDIDSNAADTNVGNTIVTPSNIVLGINSGGTDVAFRRYSNINWMESRLSFSWEWTGESLNINLVATAKSSASGWNAYHARAGAQLKLSNFKFS